MQMRLAPKGLLTALGLTVSLVGCAATESPDQQNSPVNNGFGDSGYLTPEAGTWVVPPGGGDASYVGGGDTGVGPEIIGGATGLALPPEVCTVLQKNACMACHSTPQASNAPMPLQMRDHFAINAKDGTSLAQRVLARITDTTAPMPPKSTNKTVSAADVATLRTWINGGMQGVQGAPCVEPARAITDIGSDETPSWAMRGWPTDPKECDYIMTLGAHGAAGTPVDKDQSGFVVPDIDTHYHCFYEKVPWGNEPVQAIAMRARLETPEDKALVHHFVVGGVEPLNNTVAGARPSGPGDHKPCQNPNGATMAIWAPGAINPLSYPEDVGVKLPSGDSYIELQIHYNNPKRLLPDSARTSKARYDICVTKKLRPQTAGVFWLGFENAFADTLFSGHENRVLNEKPGLTAVGSCEAKTKGRILSIMPHMHEQGIQGKFEVIRKSTGMPQSIVDDAFDFMDQKSYFRENLQVEQGDRVRTTCKYKASVHFGFGSADEMCFFYTLAYPIQLFQAGPLEKGVVGGDLACAGGFGG